MHEGHLDEEFAQPHPVMVERPPLIIRRVEAVPVALPLKKPVTMSGVTVAVAENLLVRIEAQDGSVGWGEAASAPTMTGDTLPGLVAAVRDHLAPVLLGRDAWMRPALRAAMARALTGNPGAHSAIEMALLDLAGQMAGLPIIDFIGGAARLGVRPMWHLGNTTTEADLAEAREVSAQGITTFKLKIGSKEVEEDIAATLALRQMLGSEALLCADANAGLTIDAARRYAEAMRSADLRFLEQPLDPADLDGLAALARVSPIPIGVDEGIHALADIETQAQAGAGGVSLKLIKLGGIAASLEAAQLASRLGLGVNVAAKIAESSIAAAAALHLACAIPRVDWGVSLTHFYLAQDIVRTPLHLHDGEVALPLGAGLGVEVDEAAVAQFRVK